MENGRFPHSFRRLSSVVCRLSSKTAVLVSEKMGEETPVKPSVFDRICVY